MSQDDHNCAGSGSRGCRSKPINSTGRAGHALGKQSQVFGGLGRLVILPDYPVGRSRVQQM